MIALIANYTYKSQDRSTLRRHADMIQEGSSEGVSLEQDRKHVQEAYSAVIKALDKNSNNPISR